ncbi:MAG TPA: hypothetical protein VGV39_09825 [Mesorhizobium sp.]|jgi:hypothetical protein|uniref:hypothetical protein n=1 Tax=Mesorhizobium sp. TaxID=1871066 RepID=UPI002DDD8D55|nr:hypothetical protein [Mesorhizobium sp.]HEV2503365.1 hypothetical protein [Mesorhizobium sp.]
MPLGVFWVDFEENDFERVPVWMTLGVGITAYDARDALALLKLRFFAEAEMPVCRIKPIESIEDIEQNHVRPNIGNFLRRGVWYPAVDGWS